MKKKNLEHHHHSIGIVILVVVAVMMVLVALSYFNPNILFSNRNTFFERPSIPQEEIYHSDFLNVSFVVPEGFEVDENYTDITLSHNNGDIIVSRVGTNYDDINDYAEFLEEKNQIDLLDTENLEIHGFEALRTTINHPLSNNPNTLTYMIYVPSGNVYNISTTFPGLYDELDQIAQSFKYTGD